VREFRRAGFSPDADGRAELAAPRQPSSGIDVYEIKLGDEFLMSSQFTVAEIELARLGLAALLRMTRRTPRLSMGSPAPCDVGDACHDL